MNRKAYAILSLVMGGFFGGAVYFFLGPELLGALLSVLAALLSTIFLFTVFLITDVILTKRYAAFEKVITSPVFWKADGNFDLGEGRVKNGRIYFCEAGILCVCLDSRPYSVDEILLQDVEKYQYDDYRLIVFAKDGRRFAITMPRTKQIIEILKQKDWI